MEDRYILWHFSLADTFTYATTLSKKSFVKYHDNHKSFSPAPDLCHRTTDHHGVVEFTCLFQTLQTLQLYSKSSFVATSWHSNGVRIWKKFSSFRKNGTRQLATHAAIHLRFAKTQSLFASLFSISINSMVPARATTVVGAVLTARNRAQRQRVHEHASHPLVYITAFPCQLCFQSTFFLWNKDFPCEDLLYLKWSWEDDSFCAMKQHTCRVQSQGSLALVMGRSHDGWTPLGQARFSR
jgi:hypothetical protein